ncbi:MAG: agmatine deiminase family protein [Rhodovibrionaceae bacterium]
MPAEWEPHRRCWMAWPCREALWGDRLDEARDAYAEVAKAIAQFEPVTMVALPDDIAEVSLRCGNGVSAFPLEIEDSWMRDTGPTFVADGKGHLGGVDWTFNGYGEKYGYKIDARIAEAVVGKVDARHFPCPLVTEGGAIHSDGEGTLLVVENTILNDNRNPGLTRQEAEKTFADFLGVEKVIWLPGWVSNDETDGHVDNVACFAGPGKVLAAVCSDEDDPDHIPFQENLGVLRGESDAAGRRLEIVPVEQPRPRKDDNGERLAVSYINFYLANGGVIIPSFNDPGDAKAFDAIAGCFPDRKAVEVPADVIVHGGGGIHCITQQEPAVG